MKKLSRSKGFKVTPNGQWEFPGENTLIPSNQITMKGVPYPVFGMDNTGYSQMMYPGMEYTYPGSMVYEIPMAQEGLQTGIPDFNKLYDEYKTIQSQINQYIGNDEGGKKEQEYRLKLNDLANKLVEEGLSIENTDYVPQDIKQDSNSHYCIGSSCYILNQVGENFKYFSNSNFQDDVIAGKVPGRTFDYSAKGIVPGDIIQFKRNKKGSPYHAYLIQDISAPDKDGNRKVIAVGSAGSGPMQNKEYILTKDNKITSEYDGEYDVQTIRRERFNKNIAPNDLLKKRDALKADLEKYYPNYKVADIDEKVFEVSDDPNAIYDSRYGTAFEWNQKNQLNKGNQYSPTGKSINLKDSKINEILGMFSSPDFKKQFITTQGVSSKEYDAIVKNVIGIYGQETKFGTRKEAPDFIAKSFPGLVSSVGPFQINPKNLKTQKFSREDLFDPIKGAEAAATFLAENIQMLRNRANAKPEDDIYSKNLRQDNYLEYLSYLMNDRNALVGDKKRIEQGLPILEGKSSYKRNVDQYIENLGVEAIPISRSAPEYQYGGTFNPDTDEFIGFVDDLPQAQVGTETNTEKYKNFISRSDYEKMQSENKTKKENEQKTINEQKANRESYYWNNPSSLRNFDPIKFNDPNIQTNVKKECKSGEYVWDYQPCPEEIQQKEITKKPRGTYNNSSTGKYYYIWDEVSKNTRKINARQLQDYFNKYDLSYRSGESGGYENAPVNANLMYDSNLPVGEYYDMSKSYNSEPLHYYNTPNAQFYKKAKGGLVKAQEGKQTKLKRRNQSSEDDVLLGSTLSPLEVEDKATGWARVWQDEYNKRAQNQRRFQENWYPGEGYDSANIERRASMAGDDAAARYILDNHNSRNDYKNRQEYLQSFTPKEKEVILRSNYARNFEPDMGSRFRRGLGLLTGTRSAITNPDPDLSAEDYANRNFLSNLGDIISPLSYPVNLVKGIGKGQGRSALSGKTANPWLDATNMRLGNEGEAFMSDIIGDVGFDPLNILGMDGFGSGIRNLFGKSSKLDEAGKITSKVEQLPTNSQPIINQTVTPWSMEELPGLHIQSTLSGSPLEKQLSKTGQISRNSITAHINKAEVSAADKFTLQKVLNEKFPNQNKIDYNEFRKAVSDEAIELERKIIDDYQHNNWGLSALGYTGPKKSSYEKAIANVKDEIIYLENALKNKKSVVGENNTPANTLNLEQRISEAKDQLTKLSAEYEKLPLENVSITYSNVDKFGRGSADHFDESTLGHARTLVSPEEPDIMHFLEMQSDYWQKGGKQKEFNLEKYKEILAKKEAIYLEDLETLKKIKETKMDYAGNPKSDWEIRQFEDIVKRKGEELKIRKGDVFNPEQKQFLGKNYLERLLQENVKYAAEVGKSKVRVPTSETAAKIQGYSPGQINIQSLTAEEQKIARSFGYSPEQNTILKKYSEQPKMIKKLFGVEPKVITDGKGNTWYEFDIPEKFRKGKAEIKAFAKGGSNLPLYQNKGQVENEFDMPIKDNRVWNPVTDSKIVPTRDLKGGVYSKAVIKNLVEAAYRNNMEPDTYTGLAIALQETNLGKTDSNLGHVLNVKPYDKPTAEDDLFRALKENYEKSDKLGLTDPLQRLQTYNGEFLTRDTEKKYHKGRSRAFYGVPIPEEGLDLRKNPLYAKKIVNVRDSVLLQNPQLIDFVNKATNEYANEYSIKKAIEASEKIDRSNPNQINSAIASFAKTNPREYNRLKQLYNKNKNNFQNGGMYNSDTDEFLGFID